MAFAFGENPFEVENAISNNLNTRKTKREEVGATRAPQACKRAALGTLSMNTTNVTRKQPSRAVKQTVDYSDALRLHDENSMVRPAAGKSMGSIYSYDMQTSLAPRPSFSIHVDADPTAYRSKAKPESGLTELLPLNPLVTSLPVERRPLACVFSLDDSVSPMVLDNSVHDIDIPSQTLSYSDAAGLVGIQEYAEDIFEYLREAELRNRPKPGYMRKQPDITAGMRCILIDWLVEVSEEYNLLNETLYLAVSYIDRFLSQMSVLRSKLQLVGAATMFLASKFEEIYPPEVKEFVYITDDTYTIKQVLRMEHLVLKVLSFDVAVPTINAFLARFLRAANADSKMDNLSRYLAELTLQEHAYIKYIPSTIAAAAVCLANYTLTGQLWTAQLSKFSGYVLEDIAPCVEDLLKTFTEAPTQMQQAVREKYGSQKYGYVSNTPPPTGLPLC